MEIFFTNHIKRKQQHIVLLVFARKYPSPMTKEILKMAWKIEMVSPMETIQFSYPLKNKICAFYVDCNSSKKVKVDKTLDAEPGTTWIAKTTKNGGIELKKDDFPLHFPLDGYVVYNEEPKDWKGRIIDIALHKGDTGVRPFVSKQCRVGNYVTLTDTSCLYFGAMIPSFSMAHEIKYNYEKTRRFSYEYTDFSDNSFSLIPEAEFTELIRINLLKHKSKGCVRITLTEEVTSKRLLFNIDDEDLRRQNSDVSTTSLP